MFDDLRPPVIADRDPIAPAELMSLTTEIPEGWAILKPPAGFFVTTWLIGPELRDDGQWFQANLIMQSVPMIDNDAMARASEAFVHDLEVQPQTRIIRSLTAVRDDKNVAVDHFAAEVGEGSSTVTQNFFLVRIRESEPTLVILTASAATGDQTVAPTMREICESVLGELVGQLSARR